MPSLLVTGILPLIVPSLPITGALLLIVPSLPMTGALLLIVPLLCGANSYCQGIHTWNIQCTSFSAGPVTGGCIVQSNAGTLSSSTYGNIFETTSVLNQAGYTGNVVIDQINNCTIPTSKASVAKYIYDQGGIEDSSGTCISGGGFQSLAASVAISSTIKSGSLLSFGCASACTATLPNPVLPLNVVIELTTTGAGVLTVDPNGLYLSGQTAARTLTGSIASPASVRIKSNGTSYYWLQD